MRDTSNMPARIWLINGHVYSPTVNEKEVPGISYIRADIVERMAEALADISTNSHHPWSARIASSALNSYREASNDKA